MRRLDIEQPAAGHHASSLARILLLFPLLLLLGSCNNDIDEFKFTGHIVGADMCSTSQIGYIVDILSPDSLGEEATIGGAKYPHVVMCYRASRILHQGDTISAVGYFTESYAKLNCFGNIDRGLPEVILLSVDE